MPPTNTQWLRDPPTRRQVRNDATLAFALAAASLLYVELLRSSPVPADFGWRGVEGHLWAVAIALPLCFRRYAPVTAMLLCSVAFYGVGERMTPVQTSVIVQICLFASIYSAWAWSRRRRALVVSSALVVGGMLAWVIQMLLTEDPGSGAAPEGLFSPSGAIAVMSLSVNVMYFFGAMAWGLVSWRSARQRDDLQLQAEQLRREQEANARRAVADERVRIARDLHDVVAHHVSGIGIQAAGASRLLDRDPEKSRDALSVIEHSSREAVNEMHQLVSLLRTPDGEEPDRGPSPGVDQIAHLARSAANGSFTVEYREVGEPFDVPETAGVSLYRTAQEALANVRQHSSARHAEVVLRYVGSKGRAVEVEVLDDGHPVRTRPAGAARDGFGLQGITERVQLHHGDTDIGPRPDGGFRVRVRVPVGEPA